MDSVIAVEVSPQEGLVVAIFRLARRHAQRLTSADSADDVAHDVVLECLVKWRSVRRAVAVEALSAFIRHLVHLHRTEAAERKRRTKESELEHGRRLLELERTWMDPAAAFEEDDESPHPRVVPLPARPMAVPSSMRLGGARRRRRDRAPMEGAA